MLKVRVIPVLTFNGFSLVKTRGFAHPRTVGNPIQSARVYDSRGVDELFFLDIMATRQGRTLDAGLVESVLAECFMPTAVGGGLTTVEQMAQLFAIGADKVVVGAEAFREPAFLTRAVDLFGSQALCVAVDALRAPDGEFLARSGTETTSLERYVKTVEAAGAGEILLTSIERDGQMTGFDLELTGFVRGLTRLPLVACGGAGTPEHFAQLASGCKVDGLAAASIYHFTQFTPQDVKRALTGCGIPVRLLTAC